MTKLTEIIPLRSAARPVERLPLGARVTVDLAPQLGLVIDGTICGRSLMGRQRYDVDLGLDEMRLCSVPEKRIKREGEP